MQCPNCKKLYSANLVPRSLRNCPHVMCQSCIKTEIICPIDGKRIDLRRYTLKGLPINDQALQASNRKSVSVQKEEQQNEFLDDQADLSEGNMSIATSKTTKTVLKKKKKQNCKGVQMCLLHSKPADIICNDDGMVICSNCALFGEHRGHTVQKAQDFVLRLATLTDSTLSVYQQVKGKQEDLNRGVVRQYIQESLAGLRTHGFKMIRQQFQKLIEAAKKAEKEAIANLDAALKSKRETLEKESLEVISCLQEKSHTWFNQVDTLGTAMEDVYRMKGFEAGLRYFDQKRQESVIPKTGEYLQMEYKSSQIKIKQKIDQDVKTLTPKFSLDLYQLLEEFCVIGTIKGKVHKILVNHDQVTPLSFTTNELKSKSGNEEDNLLEGQNQKMVSSFDYKDFEALLSSSNTHLKVDKFRSPAVEFQKSPAITKTIDICNRSSQKVPRCSTSRSRKINLERSDRCDRGQRRSRQREALSVVVDNKKRRKVEVPEKYRQTLQDLKNNVAEVVDFGGAELGDKVVRDLCEYVIVSTRIRSLKLVRNKITDQGFQYILDSCVSAGVTSLNLGQNSLTERCLDYLESVDLGQLKNITLSLNRINRRNVKERLEQLGQRGLTISI